ncbi:dermonecrotic toxin domain-containing protein, partial [Burkholderia ubonensis]|uniref:dermonecrotic toxin domain-containing protein n=1 Tax=Burkholderia ubonensis TaxID=101571 RepID=UPI0012F98C39
MVVRLVTGQPALPHNQVAEPEVKDPNRTSKQDRGIAVTGQLQSFAKLKDGGLSASRQAHATQTGVRAERARVPRSVPSTTAVVNSATADTSETQREQIGKLDSLSGQAMAVFDQKPRPSPLRDAQQAFETKFPNVPRPVDLNKIYVNAYQENGTPPTRVLESSRSVADYIAERYTGGGDITLDVDTEKGTTYSLFRSPNAVSDEDKVNGTTPQEIEKFINHLASDKAKDVNVQNDEYFRTPGQDDKTPLQKLGEIRKELIQVDTDLQYADGTLSKKAQDLAKKITQNPTQTDLERAYPDESKRPRVYGLSINPDSTTNGTPDTDQTLHGPLVMMTPHADYLPGGNDVVVVYLPGQGLKEFNSVAEMKSYLIRPSVQGDSEQRHALLNFLPEQAQADLSTHQLYELGDFKQVPPGKNFFEHSVQQQLDKQRRDTVYQMTQAKERGVDLTELDGIAGDSSDDLREWFDTERMLTERDVRLIEHNRPDWWKQSSQENKDLLATYQEAADQLESNLEELESKIPTLKEHAAQKIREELQTLYPDIDPDKVTVTITYYQPPEGQSRANPNPQPRFSTVTTTLTDYVVLERRLAQNPPDDKTGISGTILDMLAPGSDVAKLFRQNKVGVSATVTGTDGSEATLDKQDLNALAEKLDVGKRYGQLLTDKYGDANGQHLKTTWKAAYLARMRADAQEAEMSDVFESRSRFSNTKRPFTMVQAVLDQPDSRTQERKVDGHIVQTEELTVDIWGKGPHEKRIRESYPVDGVLVIGAVDKHGNASRALETVVLYTPDAPDGKAYRVYNDREELKSDPMFRKPEWIAYFKDRVSDAKISPVGGGSLTRKEGVGLYADPNADSGSRWTTLGTKAIAGDFAERQYQAEVFTKRENAEALSITNEALRKESFWKKFNAGLFTTLDALDFIPFGKLSKGLGALARQVNPRKLLSRLPSGTHLLQHAGGANKMPFKFTHHDATSLPLQSLKGFEVPISRDSLKNLKYDHATGIYVDGANEQYIRIGNQFYRSNLRPDASGTMQRGVFRPNNSTDRVDVERIGG